MKIDIPDDVVRRLSKRKLLMDTDGGSDMGTICDAATAAIAAADAEKLHPVTVMMADAQIRECAEHDDDYIGDACREWMDNRDKPKPEPWTHKVGDRVLVEGVVHERSVNSNAMQVGFPHGLGTRFAWVDAEAVHPHPKGTNDGE